MASTIYYGVSQTAAGESAKYVRMLDSDFNPNNLEKGDILSVYFAFKNTAVNPTLILTIGDVNHELNQSNANGTLIYNTGRISAQEGAWTDGEVVNFSYTHNGSVVENADNIYYWEIISKAIATDSTYGTVILDGDDSSAASISKVKDLIQKIGSGELKYSSSYESGIEIGTLELINYDEEGEPVPERSYSKTIYIPSIPSRTSDFINDSNYITSQLTDDLNFVGNSKKLKANNSTIIDLDEISTHNTIINSQGAINLLPTNQVNIGSANSNKNLKIYGNIEVTGTLTPINTSTGIITNLTASTISADSIIGQPSANLGSTSVTSLNIGGQSLYEYMNGYLTDPMSELEDFINQKMYDDSYFIIERSESAPTSIALKNFESKILVGDFSRIIEAGYRKLGVVRWECYRGSNSNPWDVTVYGMFWEGNKLYAKAAALTKNVNNVIFDADVLFVKNSNN